MICWGFLIFMSCQPAAAPTAAVPYCEVFKPPVGILSHRDTRRTKEWADQEYRKWLKLCGAKP